MMTQELYDRFESELQIQEGLKSDVSIKLASVHDGMIKDVWVLLGPKLKNGTSRGFIRWRWQSLTVALRAATDQMSSRDQVAQMMMEGVQFKVDVECKVFSLVLLFFCTCSVVSDLRHHCTNNFCALSSALLNMKKK